MMRRLTAMFFRSAAVKSVSLLTVLWTGWCVPPLFGQTPAATTPATTPGEREPGVVRVATFNVSLNRPAADGLREDLQQAHPQIRRIASILRTVRPDIVLLNEFDRADADSVALFQDNYLAADDGTGEPLRYAYSFTAEVNTGQPSGLDLDGNGKQGGAGDAFGFGAFPGQYAMVVLSRFPIDTERVRTFQKFLWKDLPDAAQPVNADGSSWYADGVWEQLRLSSKSHWDVPVSVAGQTLHVLASHPTPPAFDGPEGRNRRRNHDEIRLWKEYLSAADLPWLTDDQGRTGGLADDAAFVIVGDLNADPADGSSYQGAGRLLLEHPRVNATQPTSGGGPVASEQQGRVNREHKGDPKFDTADFSDRSVGNLRVDYVLPSQQLHVLQSGVFWPPPGTAGATDVTASDHRLVWVDVRFAAQ